MSKITDEAAEAENEKLRDVIADLEAERQVIIAAERAAEARLAEAVEALNHAADNLDFAGFSVSADLARQAALQSLGKVP